MIWKLPPSQNATCMACGKAAARYFGTAGTQGHCRPCVAAMPVDERLRTLQGMGPADRRLWEIDKLAPFDRREPQASGPRVPPSPPQPTQARSPAPPRGPAPEKPSRLHQPERRRHPRVEVRFPVGFSLSAVSASGRLSPRRVHAMSKDLSAGGIRVPFQDPELLNLPAGALLRLELLLPRPSVIVRCGGVVRSVVVAGRSAAGDLCVAFRDLAQTQEADLKAFVASAPPPRR